LSRKVQEATPAVDEKVRVAATKAGEVIEDIRQRVADRFEARGSNSGHGDGAPPSSEGHTSDQEKGERKTPDSPTDPA
ncbi:MAG: hypothetical protein JWO59_2622, partial [Chloroflexi bacterium]|nr:hypothetical protein [Chloroflexota bacterium]